MAQHYKLDVRQYQRVASVTGYDGAFTVQTQDLHGHDHEYTARKIVVATGYYDLSELYGNTGRGLAQGDALLQRSASVF